MVYIHADEVKAPAIATAALERLGHINQGAKKGLRAGPRDLRFFNQDELRQTTISDHFSENKSHPSQPAFPPKMHNETVDHRVYILRGSTQALVLLYSRSWKIL